MGRWADRINPQRDRSFESTLLRRAVAPNESKVAIHRTFDGILAAPRDDAAIEERAIDSVE
jgi:hypothetical protein